MPHADLSANATASMSVVDNGSSVSLQGTSFASGGLATSVTGEATASGDAEAASYTSATFMVDGTVPFTLTYAASAGAAPGRAA